jgi:hypothetical protein
MKTSVILSGAPDSGSTSLSLLPRALGQLLASGSRWPL